MVNFNRVRQLHIKFSGEGQEEHVMRAFSGHSIPALCKILGISMVVSGMLVDARGFVGGSGEPNDPLQITTLVDLISIGLDANLLDLHFILTADIDLDPNLMAGRVFDRAVIPVFGGVLDGNHHTIKNLQIRGINYLGLFGELVHGAKISELAMLDVDIVGTGNCIGGLAGANWTGDITNCYCTGRVRGDGWAVGGLAGYNIGRITSSYSTSVVQGQSPSLGGLTGINYGYVLGSFWDIEVSGLETSAAGTGLPTVQMMDINTYLKANWDFAGETENGTDDVWIIEDGNDYPRLQRESEPNSPISSIIFVDVNVPGFQGQMSRYETTNEQYCQYLNAAWADGLIVVDSNIVYAASDTDYSQPYFGTYKDNNSFYSRQIIYAGGAFSVRTRDGYNMGDHPVVNVSWYGATAFCDYYGFRLPTENEWQAVAKYDGSYIYGCGASIDQTKANYNDGGYANPLSLSSFPYTSPVGYYPAYGYGMYDMAGNVWEMTGTVTSNNPMIHGGSWLELYYSCMTRVNLSIDPGITYSDDIGFRVCR